MTKTPRAVFLLFSSLLVSACPKTNTPSDAGPHTRADSGLADGTRTDSSRSDAGVLDTTSIDHEIDPLAIYPQTQWVQLGSATQFELLVLGQRQNQVDWLIVDNEGMGETRGAISAEGVYQAPEALPDRDLITVRASTSNETAEHSFRLGDVSLSLSPDSASVALGGQFFLTLTKNTVPLNSDALSQVEWLVEDIMGGNPVLGQISADGQYVAPATMPESPEIVVTARSLHFPEQSALSRLTLVDLGGQTMLLSPQPETVACEAKVQFSATVLSGGSQVFDWYVNNVLGGNETTGQISDRGLYRAPVDIAGAPQTIEVRAQQSNDSRRSASVEFSLVELRLTPDLVRGNQVGESFGINARALYSTGQSEDVTALATTAITSLNPGIVTVGPGAQLTLADGAGVDYVRVTDRRFTPAASALLEVHNLPDYSVEVEPASLVQVIQGSRHDLSVFLIADRGPEKGDRQDISLGETLSFQSLDAFGFVLAQGEQVATPAGDYSAYLDVAKMQIVMGALPGLANFRVSESKTGKSVDFAVRLLAVDIQRRVWTARVADPLRAADECNTHPCAEGTVPYAMPTPLNTLESNGSITISLRFFADETYLSVAELAEQLSHVRVSFEDLASNGAFDTHVLAYAPGCEISMTSYIHGALWLRAQPFTPAFYRKKAVLPLLHYPGGNPCARDGDPDAFVFIEANYFPVEDGNHTLRMTVHGLSADEAIADRQFEVPMRAQYPFLTLRQVNAFGEVVDVAGQDGIGPTHFHFNSFYGTTLSTCLPYGFQAFKFRLHITKPDGSVIGAENIKVVEREIDSDVFQVFFDQPGSYQIEVQSDVFPASKMAGPFTYTVTDSGSWGSKVTYSIPTLRSLYQSNSARVSLTLKGAGSAQTLGNTNCSSTRSSSPEQTGKEVLFSPEAYTVDVTDGGRTLDLYCGGEANMGHVRLSLLTGQALMNRDMMRWAPPAGTSTLVYGVDLIVPPLYPWCHLPMLQEMTYLFPSDTCQPDGPSYGAVGLAVGKSPFMKLDVHVYPRAAVIPKNLVTTENPVVAVRISGTAVALMIERGQTPQLGDFSLLQRWDDTAVNFISLKSVTADVGGGFRLELEVDVAHLQEAAGDYRLTGRMAGHHFERPLSIGLLSLTDLDGSSPPKAIALNARSRASGRLAARRLLFKVEGIEESKGVRFKIKIESPLDGENFKLVGFGRKDLRPTHPAGRKTEITSVTTILDVGGWHDWTQTVTLWGNVTDLKSTVLGSERDLPDFLPDQTSAQENDVKIKWRDDVLDTEVILGETTAFVFEPQRVGPLRPGKTRIDQVSNRQQMAEHFNWPQLKGAPTSTCSPLNNIGPNDTERDLYFHLDNSINEDEGTGMADMAFLSVNRVAAQQDGRVHEYAGEDPIGKPSDDVETETDGFTFFGLELDGVCYDPGFGFDQEPNSQALFSFANQAGYTVPQMSNGLVPGIGGTSGGRVNLQDGRFELVTRTPGVDFPGLDCGFLVDGRPEDLGDNDLEDVAITQPLEAGGLVTAYHPFPRRVTTFAGMRDFKDNILTAMQSRGTNSAFIVTTRPLKPDGKPLVEAQLNANLLIGEWPHTRGDDNSMRLSARVDASTQVYISTQQWLVPVIVAAATGAAGAWIEGGAMLSGAGLNILVALVFTAADKNLGISLGGEEGAVAGSTAGKLAGKVAGRAAKLLKYGFKATQGAVQNVTRTAVNQGVFMSARLASGVSFGQDVAGGILASYITQKLTQAMLNENTVGGAEAFAYDQLWVQMPQSSLVNADDRRSRSFVISDLRMNRLSGRSSPNASRNITRWADMGESDSYLEMVRKSSRPLLLFVTPNHTGSATNAAVCSQAAEGQLATADFRIQVGGTNPTRIPYVRTSIAGVKRNTEEATARVHIDRRQTAVQMYLLGVEVD